LNHRYILSAPNHGSKGKPSSSETTPGSVFRGAPSGGRYRFAGTLTLLGLLAAPGVHGAPAGANIVGGSGSIAQSGATTTITQDSARLAINWNSFSSKAGESIVFRQPGASAIALNRVIGTGASELSGSLNANGQVFILNPNGVLFGAGATVNAQGLLASTLDMDPSRFMQGGQEHVLEGTGTGTGAGSLGNQGKLTAYPGGYIALIAPKVVNQGSVSAQQGYVLMAAGDKARVQLSDSGLLDYTIDRGSLDALVDNRVAGMISANGGTVMLEAKAADALGKALVNHDGMIEAQTLNRVSGRVKLLGDMQRGQLTMNGRIDVSAPVDGAGGKVATSAAKVAIRDGAVVKMSATSGAGGEWVIDPEDFFIVQDDVTKPASSIGARTLEDNLKNNPNTVITVETNNAGTGQGGDLSVLAPLSWQGATLKLSAYRNIFINQDINVRNSAGLILAVGQGGVKGDYFLNNAKVDLASNASFQTINGANAQVKDYTIITTLRSGGGGPGSLIMQSGKNYVLGQDIDASDTKNWNSGRGFLPGENYAGSFDGLGHKISGLYISQRADDPFNANGAGLFASTTATASVRNLGMIDAEVNAERTAGIVVGKNLGSISNVYSTGKVSGPGNKGIDLGGLVGENQGRIDSSWSSANVTGVQSLGGLVGYHNSLNASITNSYALGNIKVSDPEIASLGWMGGLVGINQDGTISTSYAAGAVSGSHRVGGLVGASTGLVSDSYAVGTVTGRSEVGGLVGMGSATSTFRRTYASGGVTGADASTTGGLVGTLEQNAKVISSYWNTDAVANGGTGIPKGSNTAIGSGKTGEELRTLSTFKDVWGISNAGGSNATWRIYEGKGMPLLRAFLKDVEIDDTVVLYNGNKQEGGKPVADPSRSFTNATGRNVGTYSPSSTQQGYDIAGGNLTITPESLTVSTADVTKTYDRTFTAPGAPTVIKGTLYKDSGDKLSGGKFDYIDQNAGTGKTVSVSGVTVDDGNGGKNYVVSFQANASSTINRAPLTVSTDNFTKSYNGDNDASDAVLVVNGLIAGDTFKRATRTFSSVNAGPNTVNISNVIIDDGRGGLNYDVKLVPNTASTITRAPVAVSTVDVNRAYNGTTSAAGAAVLVGGTLFGRDRLAGGAFTFNDKNASDSYKTVNLSSVSVLNGDGIPSGNYEISYKPNVTSNITRAPLTFTVNDIVKTYDGTNSAKDASVAIKGTVFSQDSPLAGTITFADKNGNAGGNKKLDISFFGISDGNNGGNYDLTYVPSTNSRITPAPLTVSVDNVIKTYDGTLAAAARPVVSGGTLFRDDSLAGNGLFAFTDRNAGTGNKTVSVSGVTVKDGNGGQNYQVSYASNRSSTINPAVLTVSTGNVAKTYDGTVNAPGAAAAIVEGRLYDSDTLSGGAFAFADRNAGIGNKTVTVSNVTVNDGNGGNNYLLRLAPNLASTISPAPLIVTANDDRKAYDTTPYRGGNGVVISGLTGGDNADVVSGKLAYSGNAQGALLPGSYNITPGGLESRNYAISYASGALQIEQPPDLTSRVNVFNPMQRPGAEQTPMIGGATVQVAGCGVSLPANALGVDCIAASAQRRR
jgi:filamentous hemagglutinin family protein